MHSSLHSPLLLVSSYASDSEFVSIDEWWDGMT